MGERRRLGLLVCLLWLASECGWAEPGRFAISQVAVRPPVVTVYLDVLDENGQPPVRLLASTLAGVYEGQKLKASEATPFDASGEGVAYIFLVDVSKSIGLAQFAQIRQAIEAWIDGLKNADEMTIFSFGAQYRQLVGFTVDKARLKSAVQSLRPTDSQTKLYLALSNAINLSRQTTGGLPSRRVIVVLSDGKDEGSGITDEDVREVIQQSHVPIYAIGSSRLPVRDREHYLQVLNRLATLSGGIYTPAASVKAAYAEMESAIRRLFVVQLECKDCKGEGQAHELKMMLTSGGVTRNSAPVNVSLVVPAESVAQEKNDQPGEKSWWEQLLEWAIKWKGVLALVFVVGLGFTVGFRVELGNWVVRLFKGNEKIAEEIKQEIRVIETEIKAVVAPLAERGRSIQLTVVAGKERGHSQHLNLVQKLVIGRDGECDASFPDDTEMSGKHYELLAVGPHVEVNDLGSTNGTLLNGAQLVTSHRLVDGDLVRAGRTEVRINIGGVT